MKLGLSISTHSNNNILEIRYEIIEECLYSLKNNSQNIHYINIICDDITDKHERILRKFNFNIIKKKSHGGVSRTKNTGIASILENNCDIGFLCDDDMLFKDKNIFECYSENMIKSQLPHFSYYVDKLNCKIVKYNDTEILKTPMVNGCFLTFDKKLIEEVGYFKILPHKFGHEHSNFSRRCVFQNKIPFFCDIKESSEYLSVNKKSWNNRTIFNMDYTMFKENEIESIKHLQKYVPCEE